MKIEASEAQIRDVLAEKLNTLESGMTLIKKEYHLPNVFGSRGYIDIFAKDKFGNFVVIEIKKSDQTAREAIHELFKYAALLRQNHKIKKQNIRCIIVSTEWRELRVPFNELKRSSDYPIDGYSVKICENDIECALADEIDESEALEICASHLIYLYADAEKASKDIDNIKKSIRRSYHNDFLVVGMVYCGDSESVIYPICNYLIQRKLHSNEVDSMKSCFSEDQILESGESNSYFEDEVWSKFNGGVRDSAESGYPEKISAMLYQHDWKIVGLLRFGCFEKYPLTDEELMKSIMGLDGDSSDKFVATMSPRFKSQWEDLKDKMGKCLIGNPVWRECVEKITHNIETKRKNATVSLSIFNPCNILMQLIATHVRGGEIRQWLPKMEIIIEDPDRKEQLHYEGIMEWNGSAPLLGAQEVVENIISDEFSIIYKMSTGAISENEYEIAAQIGLKYRVLERVLREDEAMDEIDGDDRRGNILSVEDFARENPFWIDGAVDWVRTFSYGI